MFEADNDQLEAELASLQEQLETVKQQQQVPTIFCDSVGAWIIFNFPIK